MLDLNNLKNYLIKTYNCHSMILYGSYSNNTQTNESDLDVICFSDDFHFKTDNSVFQNVQLDCFIYDTDKMNDIENLTHLYGGKILLDNRNFCSSLLTTIEKSLISKNTFTSSEIQHQKAWLRKMLKRSNRGDIEGNFRYHWLLVDSLEIYFMVKGYIYLGPKKSLNYLEEKDPIAFKYFNTALNPSSNYDNLEALIMYILNI
ncbi:nucleotidyltransferase domain-containing protein [uncultured Clostridium sp.]|uniref:nucleotidyltransferase domain-containing protein n=1 Tax=uncultured Clostridium sp. TaxID=59620 RepID=UPI00260F04FA|nr:nucleotidyltransferase domain-containing protein [uncultured Clostridium sp.]